MIAYIDGERFDNIVHVKYLEPISDQILEVLFEDRSRMKIHSLGMRHTGSFVYLEAETIPE